MSLVDIYSVAVVVTAGLAVMIGCVAVARLCRGHALVSLVSMSVVAEVLTVGVMSMSVYFGFPNIGIAVIAIAVAPSILLKPTMSPGRAFFVVSGMMLIGVYNWWPLALLAMPTLAVATLRLWKHAGATGHRRITLVAIGFTAIVMVAPVLLTLHFGVSHLLITGGIPPTPWWLVFASSFALVAAVALRQVLTRESLPTLLLGAPALFGAVGVIALIAYELGQPQGVVSYYGEKAGDALAAFSLVGLALLLADALSKIVPRLVGSRVQAVLVGVAAVLASVAVFQVNGYVGPRQSEIATGQAAPGFLAHAQWTSLPHTLDPIADSFLDSVDGTTARLAQTGGLPETYSYADIEGLDPRPDWTDLWFACLVGGLDTPRLNRAYLFYQLTGVRDPATAAGILTRVFPPDAAPGLRLVVPQALATALAATSSQWVIGSNVFPKG